MKLISILVTTWLLSLAAWGHAGAPLGPNGGRMLEFSKDGSLHGELTLTNGTFRVALLDKNRKPVALDQQSLTVQGGDRNRPEKPAVTRDGNSFTFPALAGEKYPLVFQFRATPNGRAVTARMTFDASICSACKQPEWRCQCGEDDDGPDHDHDHDHAPKKK